MVKHITKDQKMAVLQLILDKKDVLFGAFSPTITKEIKENCWEDIAKAAAAMGIFQKAGKQIRDDTFQNWRRRSIEKRDNRRKTGSAGGKSCIITKEDEIIYNIIGFESPSLDGLNIPESSGSSHNIVSTADCEVRESVPLPNEVNSVANEDENADVEASSSKTLSGLTKRQTLFKAKVAEKKKIAQSEEDIRAKKKILLDLEIYKKKLEVYEIENRLEIQRSQYTKDFNKGVQEIIIVVDDNEISQGSN